jgi:hypothetical protein
VRHKRALQVEGGEGLPTQIAQLITQARRTIGDLAVIGRARAFLNLAEQYIAVWYFQQVVARVAALLTIRRFRLV